MTTMPTDFPTWYATVEAGQGGKAAARWAGVSKAIAEPKTDEVEALIRLALKSRQGPVQSVSDRIIGNIRAGDPTFDTTSVDREVQVLAASALVARLIPSDIAALSLTTAHLDGARKPGLPMDLFGLAENAVRSKAQSSRTRKKLDLVDASKVEWEPSEEKLAEMTPTEMVQALRNAATAAIAGTVKSINKVFAEAEKAKVIADEELQMLWWLIGGHLTSGEPIDDLKSNLKPLAVGRDLATRTVQRPGPVAIPALLSKAGLSRRSKIKIVDAVNAIDADWAKSVVDGLTVSPVTHPIHEAIRRRNETGAGTDWVKNWSAVCEVPEDYALTSLRLGELFYRERMLLTVA